MEHLLDAWPLIAKHIDKVDHTLVLADYDGTLTPIVARPELAELQGTTRNLINDLARQSRVTVGLVSGRSLEDLRGKVGIRGIIYVGNHGLEIQGPGISFVHPVARELKPLLQRLCLMLTQALESVKGALVEDKGLTCTVHYRLVDEGRASDIASIVYEAIEKAGAEKMVVVASGKKVYEVRPATNWDKGQAVKLLVETSDRTRNGLTIYLGDDLTDEDAFRMIRRYDYGVSVLVGEPTSASQATYFLRSLSEVSTFLTRILEKVAR
jgi:trehalose 6-phosphate phosphatase